MSEQKIIIGEGSIIIIGDCTQTYACVAIVRRLITTSTLTLIGANCVSALVVTPTIADCTLVDIWNV